MANGSGLTLLIIYIYIYILYLWHDHAEPSPPSDTRGPLWVLAVYAAQKVPAPPSAVRASKRVEVASAVPQVEMENV